MNSDTAICRLATNFTLAIQLFHFYFVYIFKKNKTDIGNEYFLSVFYLNMEFLKRKWNKNFFIVILSGNIRRFRRVCEHIQSQVCSRNIGMAIGTQSRAAPPSPRACRKFNVEMSESSSCGSDTSVVYFNKVIIIIL